MLIRVSKEKRKCWVTYLNGEDPDTEHEFYYGMSVSYLAERDRSGDQAKAAIALSAIAITTRQP